MLFGQTGLGVGALPAHVDYTYINQSYDRVLPSGQVGVVPSVQVGVLES